MRHIEKALQLLIDTNTNVSKQFISIENNEDVKGVAPIVKFTIQSDPISEVGVNGIQAVDILEYTKCLFQSLNDAFPCRENALTITKIEEAFLACLPEEDPNQTPETRLKIIEEAAASKDLDESKIEGEES